MGGKDEAVRNKVRMWIHAAEGTFMVHCLAITYARWFAPESVQKSGELKELEKGLAINVGKDLDCKWQFRKVVSLNCYLSGHCSRAMHTISALETCQCRKLT